MTDENFPTDSTNPVSNNRVEANRKNAQKATGPKTKRGRQFSSRNAWKHGLSRATLIKGEFTDENERERTALLKALYCQFHPVGPWEEILVDKIGAEFLRIFRATRLETAILTKGAPDFQQGSPFPQSRYAEYMGEVDQSLSLLSTAKEKILEGHAWNVEWAPLRSFHITPDPLATASAMSAEILNSVMSFVHEILPTSKLDEHKSRVVEIIDLQIQELREMKTFLAKRSKAASDVNYKLPPGDEFSLVLRYRSEAQRAWYRDIGELERVQAKRKGATVFPPAVVDVRT